MILEFLQYAGLGGYGQNLGMIFQQLEYFGFFDYILPFLLIFAMVYGILDKSHILGKNIGVNLVIAVALGLLALAFGDVSVFFSTIFPKAGIGLSILLVALILMGIFVPMGEEGTRRWGNYVFFGLGIVLFVYIVFTSLQEFSFWRGDWLGTNWPLILTLVLAGGVVGGIAAGSKTRDKE